MTRRKISVSWSGGKDSAFALYKALLVGEFDVVNVHTVFNAESRRVGMHGVHETLIEKQAQAIGVPLDKLYLEASEDHDAYARLMGDYYKSLRKRGVEAVVFGDIFLQDLKAFRDELLDKSGLIGIYPLWQVHSGILIDDFVNLGFKTIVCAINANLLEKGAAGKTVNKHFIDSLPPHVDACGENGEFHTFVYGGPIFSKEIKVEPGEIVSRSYKYKMLNAEGETKEIETPFFFCELRLS